MAVSKALLGSLLLGLLLVNLLLETHQTLAATTEGAVSSSTTPTQPQPNAGPPINCNGECGRRCSATKRPNRCNRACLSCCHRCNCVPPGTYGNYESCACYANLKNPKNGARKCP